MNKSKQSIKKLVKLTFEKHSVSQITAESLKNIIKSEGYFIAKFSSLTTERHTEEKLEELGISHYTEFYDSFTYSDRNTRIVFIRKDVSDEEFLYLLSLELGRILTHTDISANVIGLSAKDTENSHEFAYHIKDLSHHGILYNTVKYYPFRSVAGICAVLFCLVMLISSVIPAKAPDVLPESDTHNNTSYASSIISQEMPTPDVQANNTNNEPVSTGKVPEQELAVKDNFVVSENDIRYSATENGKKYHLDGCSYISGKNTVTVSQSEISSGKYTPCSRCFK